MSPNTASPLSRFGYRVSVPSRGKRLFAPPKCQHWLRGPPPSYSMSNGGSFTRGKPAGAWSWPLTPIKALWRVQGQRNFTFSIPCIIIHLLQFEPTNAHNFIEVTITLQHTSCYMFRSLLIHHQEHKIVCIRWFELW